MDELFDERGWHGLLVHQLRGSAYRGGSNFLWLASKFDNTVAHNITGG